MSDLSERLFKHANDTINDWQGTADDWEAYARRTDAVCAEAARDIQRLTRELAEAKEALDEALPLLNHLSRETSTDHIGDEWLTPTAQRARNVAARFSALKEKP